MLFGSHTSRAIRVQKTESGPVEDLNRPKAAEGRRENLRQHKSYVLPPLELKSVFNK